MLLRQNETTKKIGVFSLKAKSAEAEIPALDGSYENLIDGRTVTVKDGKLRCDGRPVIFTLPNPITKKY